MPMRLPRIFMFKQLFDAAWIGVEAATFDENELREIRNTVLELFEKQGIPFTTETLHAFHLGMAGVLFSPDRHVSRHIMAALQKIIHQRREVEARANV
jgi:hypothetical protein